MYDKIMFVRRFYAFAVRQWTWSDQN